MSSYTMELRHVCNLYGRDKVEGWFKDYELTDFLTEAQAQAITSAGVWSKDKLAKKIVDHYYMREIGFETPALFEHFAKISMLEIMEKKLPLIYTNSIEYNPLENINVTETISRGIDSSGSNSTTGNTTGNGTTDITNTSVANDTKLNIASDTPQTNVTKEKILAGNYSSTTVGEEGDSTVNDTSKTTAETTSNMTTSGSTKGSITENVTTNRRGNDGIYITNQVMLKQYRELIVAVDFDVIKSLNDLFFGLY